MSLPHAASTVIDRVAPGVNVIKRSGARMHTMPMAADAGGENAVPGAPVVPPSSIGSVMRVAPGATCLLCLKHALAASARRSTTRRD
jgi:hypothetical protein